MPTLKAKPDWHRCNVQSALRADSAMRKNPVDRENNCLHGYVVAQEGTFKDDRGQFDKKSLKQILDMMGKKPGGLKSRFGHPTLSADGLGKFLGRVQDGWMSNCQSTGENGEPKTLGCVRGKLQLDPTAMQPMPGSNKPLGEYVLDLAESDPDALSSSLVLQCDEENVLDPLTKKPMLDDEGKMVPPLWRPTVLHASDVVDTGAACDGILQAELGIEGLPDDLVRQASALLNSAFPGDPREVVESRLRMWLDSYLGYRFGDIDESLPEPVAEVVAKLGISRELAKMRTRIAADKLKISMLGVIPPDPPGGGGKAMAGAWEKPNLSDFTPKRWDQLTDQERKAIACYYAWYSDLSSFANLKMPHHFYKGPQKPKASIDGCHAVLARLNQTDGPTADEKLRIRSHIMAHLNETDK